MNNIIPLPTHGFPDSSAGKESVCNAGDPSWIPGLGRSLGEGIDYPFQYSWTSLVAQLVKTPPAMWYTCVWSLGWEDPLVKGKATHSSFLPGEFHGPYSLWGHKESDTTERLSFHFTHLATRWLWHCWDLNLLIRKLKFWEVKCPN